MNINTAYGHAPINALDNSVIARRCPSAFSEKPLASTSSRYNFIPTYKVIDSIRNEGWLPVLAGETRTRKDKNKGFTKHVVRFRHADDIRVKAVVGEYVPEIVLVNSHDGKSSYQLHGGLYRFVCSNGMVVSDGVINKIKVRHSNTVVDDVIEGTCEIVKTMPEMLDTVDDYRSLNLSDEAKEIYAEAAASIRWGDDDLPVRPVDLLRVNRKADHDIKDTLWGSFNSLQENLINGVRGINPKTGRRNSTRKVETIRPRIL